MMEGESSGRIRSRPRRMRRRSGTRSISATGGANFVSAQRVSAILKRTGSTRVSLNGKHFSRTFINSDHDSLFKTNDL